MILANLGLKIYAPLDVDPIYLFADFQFGGLGVEAREEYYWSPYGSYYEQEQQTLIGPTLLFGGEIRFEIAGAIAGGFGAALGLSYILNDIDWIDYSIMPTLDLGIHLYVSSP